MPDSDLWIPRSFAPWPEPPRLGDRMTREAQDRLRAPFPENQIGKLPRVYCRACSENKREKHCEAHQLQTCQVCRNRISTAHLHLDFVGHAAVVSRLLEVDPTWNWRPVTKAELELLMPPGADGFWLALQVLGHERFGFGDSEGKTGADAIKARLSDAIKNAAQRFGVALDLWSKEDLSAREEAAAESKDEARRELGGDAAGGTGRDWLADVAKVADQETLTAMAVACKAAGEFQGAVLAAFRGRKKQFDDAAKKAAAKADQPPTPAAEATK